MSQEPASSKSVQVVTDSTADIPAAEVTRHHISVVPLSIQFGDETFLDRIEISADQFVERLQLSNELPKTSQPSVAAFEAAFQQAIAHDADVVCVCLTAGLSGTYNAARLAAEAVASDRITVIDSQSASMATGWCAIAAAQRAAEGGSRQEVVAAAESARGRYQLYAALDTLDYLHKGGRIGRARQLVGSMLSMKPIVAIEEGEVRPVERVRTWRKALERMVSLAEAQRPLERLAVLHVGNPSDAAYIADRLKDLVGEGNVLIGEIGPVVATYSGPGAIGIVTLRVESSSTG
ncbi:MAG: DegV family protein [Thermomicrobiales bacterium]|jgi:DegV family protein with EDD domain